MSQYVKLIHRTTKEIKEVKLGFSWVTLLFGIFVPLIRGHFIFFFVLLALSFLGGLGIFLGWFVCPFFINKQHYDWLLNRGYTPLDEFKKEQQKEEEDRMFKQAIMAKIVS